MDFVFTLHSHLPYVLNHGRWPHGSDWLCEAALDTYLPLLEIFRGLEADAVPAPVTIGFTPVLANQLINPTFVSEMETFFDQRIAACDEAPASLAKTGDTHLLPLVQYWRERLVRLRELFRGTGQDIIGAYRALGDRRPAGDHRVGGHSRLSAAARPRRKHPAAACSGRVRASPDIRSITQRLLAARMRLPAERTLGAVAYGTEDGNAPRDRRASGRCRISILLRRRPSGSSGQTAGPLGDPAGDLTVHAPLTRPISTEPLRSPYRAYRVAHGPVAAYVRDPKASMQVWSRFEGYPGDEWYLEFHKMRWPGGLKLWRVSGPGVDLGQKQPYNPATAADRARGHADHFAHLLAGIAAGQAQNREGVVVAPFDTELFGHWWFEGPMFLGDMYRALVQQREMIAPATGSRHLRQHPPRAAIRLPWGSWGANGDSSMWLSQHTAWTWERLWPLEQSFWDVAPSSIASPVARPVLAQAARELLLAQSSDWQFIISTGAAADYAERRIRQHCADAEELIAALASGDDSQLESAQRRAEELGRRDQLFPNVIPAIAAALGGSRSLVVG